MSENGEEHKLELVSDKDQYLWSFLSLKSGLDITYSLNEQIPKIVDSATIYELIKENTAGFKEAFKKYQEKLRNVEERVEKEGLKKVYVSLNSDDSYEKIFFEQIALNQSKNIIPNMSLVYAVALFEDFIQKTLLITFKNIPEALKTCQKSVTYEDLLEYGDIEKAINAITEKELLVVNEDIEEIKNYIVKKFSIDVSKFVNWNDFKERFYRRNIIVHNSGMPNKLYREKTGFKGENTSLNATKEYLKESINLFLAMAWQIKRAFETLR
jgi:hypothetical protein